MTVDDMSVDEMSQSPKFGLWQLSVTGKSIKFCRTKARKRGTSQKLLLLNCQDRQSGQKKQKTF